MVNEKRRREWNTGNYLCNNRNQQFNLSLPTTLRFTRMSTITKETTGATVKMSKKDKNMVKKVVMALKGVVHLAARASIMDVVETMKRETLYSVCGHLVHGKKTADKEGALKGKTYESLADLVLHPQVSEGDLANRLKNLYTVSDISNKCKFNTEIFMPGIEEQCDKLVFDSDLIRSEMLKYNLVWDCGLSVKANIEKNRLVTQRE